MKSFIFPVCEADSVSLDTDSSFIAFHVHEGIAQLKCLIPGFLLWKVHAEKEVSCNDVSIDVPSVDDELSVTLMSVLVDVKGQTSSC